ncbi:MAG: PIN domain nuclease [Verrucomicrobia bacterium]|nr:MAG: PIN domain nuclease [Verrucomicrobiota bacterium]
MTLVDTSVWIDFLEGGSHWTKDRLKQKIENRETLIYTDMILLEILLGIRAEKDRADLERRFETLILAPQKRSTVILAAEIYQELKRKGITIRSIVDCLIAATAIETGASILHRDRDFDFIAKYYPIIVEKE